MAEVIMHGMEDLEQSLEYLMKKYPDRAGEFLRKQAMETRKGTVKEAKQAVDVNMSNDKSLGKIKNYSVSQVKGYGTTQEVELSAKSPHFHLIEHGHQLVGHFPGRKSIGWVPGYMIMDAERKRQEVKMPVECAKWADELLAEEGFL